MNRTTHKAPIAPEDNFSWLNKSKYNFELKERTFVKENGTKWIINTKGANVKMLLLNLEIESTNQTNSAIKSANQRISTSAYFVPFTKGDFPVFDLQNQSMFLKSSSTFSHKYI